MCRYTHKYYQAPKARSSLVRGRHVASMWTLNRCGLPLALCIYIMIIIHSHLLDSSPMHAASQERASPHFSPMFVGHPEIWITMVQKRKPRGKLNFYKCCIDFGRVDVSVWYRNDPFVHYCVHVISVSMHMYSMNSSMDRCTPEWRNGGMGEDCNGYIHDKRISSKKTGHIFSFQNMEYLWQEIWLTCLPYAKSMQHHTLL